MAKKHESLTRENLAENPFSDQWSIKSTLDKDSSDHWSAWSKDGSLDHSSITFLWARDPKLIILPSGAQFEISGYFIYWPERLLAIAPQILRYTRNKIDFVMLNRSATDRRYLGFPSIHIVINTCSCLNSIVWVYYEKMYVLLMNSAN